MEHISVIYKDKKHMTVFMSAPRSLIADWLEMAASTMDINTIVRHDDSNDGLYKALDQAVEHGYTIFGDPRKEVSGGNEIL